ncbi:rhomboid family intramembrane serine protease [Alteribacillus sp. HJP-4]|uniref:rhomboid family intramembrane serine protease n=1 Tax=Alteribacillus sp. HJP-4 TaxID=2775394 RepID=UPI0035CD3773
MFIRNESFSSFKRNYPVITTLIVINVILFLWINLSLWTGGLFPLGLEIRQLGIGINGAIAEGQYWRLLTPVFLHQGTGHILFNSVSLILFAPALEKMIGSLKFLAVYLLTGFLANVATFLLIANPAYSHLGASGAIFGVFGVYLYMVINRKELIDAMNTQIIMIIIVIGVVSTFINPGINILGHLFGLISGAAIAPLFLRKAKSFYSV